MAFWYQLPLPQTALKLAIGAWAIFALGVLCLEITRRSWISRGVYGLALIAAALWWAGIRPSFDHEWAPDVEHIVTGTRDGDIVTLKDVRDFDWKSETDFTPRWQTRTYDLSKLETVDLFLSYWSSPAIAHTLVSFGFEGGEHIVFSAEIRKEKGESFSSIGGFFKEFDLALIAADERDIIRLRTNIRGEDVYRYPIHMPQAGMRELFLSYLETGNRLATVPTFYNTVTTNCTTVVFRLLRALDPALPFDYRILLSGYLPGYIYQNQGFETGLTEAEFRARAAISALGIAAGDSPDFSAAIRAAGTLPR
ncbi:Lnb N-terminal periplasmic domain-containing protein [Kaistia sp. MMO-174]|uniref:Lnb N-terminal periplasmic domain-containing protein n=1 Tax=Kaistia sp. MMO-174 TaxID=3081256 RepID=UPI00301A2C13